MIIWHLSTGAVKTTSHPAYLGLAPQARENAMPKHIVVALCFLTALRWKTFAASGQTANEEIRPALELYVQHGL